MTEAASPPRDARAAQGFALIAFILLTFAMLAVGNAPAPLLHDMAEAFAWGQEFQLGYNQHPPFWAWVCGAWFLAFPHAPWAFAALDALNAGVGLAGAYALIGDFARGDRRVAAFALLLLTPVYTLGAYKYDANTIFLSLWPWATHAFLRALRTRRLGWALAFGALGGLALLSKYYAVLLIALCALAALITRDGRAYLRSASPWISAAVAAALFAPHAVWLARNGAPPVRYFQSASSLPWGVVARGAWTTAWQTLAAFALVFAVVAVFARRRRDRAGAALGRDERRLLAILGLGPPLLTIAAGVVFRVRLTPEMPIGVLALVPLGLLEAVRLADAAALARFSRRAAWVGLAAMTALAPVVMIARAYGTQAAHAAPYREAAGEVARLWRERTGAPLVYVGGYEYAHYLAFYAPGRAHAFFKFDPALNLWIAPDDLARRGWVGACGESEAECLEAARARSDPTTQRIEIVASRLFLGRSAAPRRLVVFLTPPRT